MSLREELANLCHEQWSGWMEYLFNKCDMVPQKEMYATSEEEKVPVIPEYFYKKWMRQIITKHKDLSEEEKESDRKEADKFLCILDRELSKERQAKEELLEALKHSNISMISKRQVAINEQLIAKHTKKEKEKYSD